MLSLRHLTGFLVVLLLTPALSGCLGGLGGAEDSSTDSDAALAFTPCEHPWPCADGTEWPEGLEGPFDVLEPEHVTVESFDGTRLDGWVWRPDLPEGVGAPVLLEGTPYLGKCSYQSVSRGTPFCTGSGGMESRLDGSKAFEKLIAEGYAVAIFSVRGTAGSGGCYDLWGEDEQRDQVAVVEWLAAQSWSNGRVGMTGLSYAGTTPIEAAIHQAPSLKAITVGGIITDVYLGPATPQGAIFRGYDQFRTGTFAANSLQPPWSGGGDTMAPYVAVAPERLCTDTPDTMLGVWKDEASDDRNAAWWEERRLSNGLGDVQAAVLVAHGLHDNSFHRTQEDVAWEGLTQAPKWFILGQWGHVLSFEEQMASYDHAEGWIDLSLQWYDFWLKGLGHPPARLGMVDYQASSGEWRESTAWPPAGASEEALHLAGDALAPTPGEGARALALEPVMDDSADCTDDLPDPVTGAAPQLIYATAPLSEDVVLAGNPYALLTVRADKPRGLFAAVIGVAGSDWSCETGGPARGLTTAAADLRFHEGDMTGRDFPVDTPTAVRLDFFNVAERVTAGERLILVLRNGDDFMGQHDDTTLRVEGESHLVLPVVEGTLGGDAPAVQPPPRPFAPGAAKAGDRASAE